MQCPVCEHEAPVANFGEPLRCPDCRAFYEKAVIAKAQDNARPAPTLGGAGMAPRNPGTRESVKASNAFWIYVSVITGLFVAYLLVSSFVGSESSNKPKKVSRTAPCGSAGMAHTMAGNFVKRQLKAPSSAKFPYTSDPQVSVTELGRCRFSVVSYVDSQNAFGAMIRSHFTVVMESEPDGQVWRAHDLLIE